MRLSEKTLVKAYKKALMWQTIGVLAYASGPIALFVFALADIIKQG